MKEQLFSYTLMYMSQTLRLTVKSTLFHKAKLLLIEPEMLQFDYVNASVTNAIKMTKFDIAEIRFGVAGIRGYKFYIGRTYCIDIKNITGAIIRIRLTSLYRINRKRLEEKYVQIVNALFENYFNSIIQNYLTDFSNGRQLTLLNTTITQVGIQWSKDMTPVCWHDVDTKRYWSYFTVFSMQNANNYKAYEYRKEWNAMVLYGVISSIAASKRKL